MNKNSETKADTATAITPSLLDDEATFEKLADEFDHNMKIAEFFIETESFYDLELTLQNLKKVSMILSDSSGIVIIFHKKYLASQYPRNEI